MWTPTDIIVMLLTMAIVIFVILTMINVVFFKKDLSDEKLKILLTVLGSILAIISMYIGFKKGQ